MQIAFYIAIWGQLRTCVFASPTKVPTLPTSGVKMCIMFQVRCSSHGAHQPPPNRSSLAITDVTLWHAFVHQKYTAALTTSTVAGMRTHCVNGHSRVPFTFPVNVTLCLCWRPSTFCCTLRVPHPGLY